MILLAQGISRYNISKTKAMDIELSMPKIKEQEKIGAFLYYLDNLITLHQRKHEKLQNIKKALLSKMFA
jgi:type I restriction enzyme S subunit